MSQILLGRRIQREKIDQMFQLRMIIFSFMLGTAAYSRRLEIFCLVQKSKLRDLKIQIMIREGLGLHFRFMQRLMQNDDLSSSTR